MTMELQQPEPLSIPDHGPDFWLSDQDGVRAYFSRDLLGRLIWDPRPASPTSSAPPFSRASRPVVFPDEHAAPQPWHWTRSRFTRELRAAIEQAPEPFREVLTKAFPNAEVPATDWLWLPFHQGEERPISGADVEAVIDALESPGAEARLVARARAKLAAQGIAPLPEISTYQPDYHDVADGEKLEPGEPVRTRCRGWSSDGQVLRKAIVEPK